MFAHVCNKFALRANATSGANSPAGASSRTKAHTLVRASDPSQQGASIMSESSHSEDDSPLMVRPVPPSVCGLVGTARLAAEAAQLTRDEEAAADFVPPLAPTRTFSLDPPPKLQ